MRRCGWLGLLLAILSTTAVSAAPTAEQRAEILAIGTVLTKAGNLYTAQKFKEAAESVKEVQSRLDKLATGADASVVSQLEPIHKRLVRAHALLELEGIALPPLKPLEEKPATAADGKTGGAGTISFVKQVAPILNARCGGCHVRNSRGMFSMATYEALIKGPPAGKVVVAGNVPGSDLIVKVEDKEMPPSGAGIPDAELATLKKWVEEGAKFDGPDPGVQLVSLVPGGQAAGQPMVTVQQATGKETVSFAKDIAPVLVANCTGCHGTNNPRNNFSLNTFEQLLRGGDRGEPVLPGKPADSLLIKKLKGTADGARMPMGRQPLDDAFMVKIEKWIEEGARFDAPNAKQPIFEVAAIAKAESSTHEELSADRAKLADERWRRVMPAEEALKVESRDFLVIGGGRIGENTLAEVAKQAEAMSTKVADILKAPADQPLVKGRVSLYVFGERYDYGEFGMMVEKRELPSTWRGHFGYTIVDAYGAILIPKGNSEDYSVDALIAQELAAVHVASQGRGVPRWFAEGVGRVIASRLAPASDKRVRAWDDQLPEAFAKMSAPDDFLTGKLSPEEADICSYSFARFLMADPRRFQLLLDSLRKGAEFTAAFSQTFGGTPNQVAVAWSRKPPKAKR